MALAALSLPGGNVGFDAEGTAMVPVSSGESKLGTIEVKSPLDTFKETFEDIKESLGAMVGLQSKEEKRQEFINKKLLEQHEFERKQMNQKFVDEGMAGPEMPSNDDLEGVDTDDKTYGNFVEKAENAGAGILDGIKDAFGQVSFGEKMMAIVLAGGFALFSKYSKQIEKVLQPIVQFVMDTIDFLGPEGAFAAFIGGFILLKSGLAAKAIKGAGGLILKGIKASAAAIDRQGGIVKAMGNGFEAINKGAKSLVGQLGKMGSTITGGLTKGFTLLGRGLTGLKLGIMSMSSSLGAMLVPFLPVIAIAAAVVAVLYSLKSGFETFKQSLDNGDSMFTAVLKGLGDAMLTLVTLPYVLIQKLVGFIAGLFGFDNFKEKLESFSIKDKIVEVFKSLTSGMVNIIKAIAKGAAAALAAALPGGKTPQEEFARVYGEVMKGGEGESAALQGTADFQGDQSQADFNKDSAERDKVKGYDRMGEYDIGGDEGMGTGNATAISYYKKQAVDQRYRDLGTGPKANLSFEDEMRMKGVTMGATGSDDFGGAVYDADGNKVDYLAELMKNTTFESKQVTTRTLKENGKITGQDKSTIVVKGGNVTGDTINQMSETNITGELEVNNTEHTQKIIQEHF